MDRALAAGTNRLVVNQVFGLSNLSRGSFALKDFQYNADLFFSGIATSGRTTDIANRIFSAAFLVVSCGHHRSSSG